MAPLKIDQSKKSPLKTLTPKEAAPKIFGPNEPSLKERVPVSKVPTPKTPIPKRSTTRKSKTKNVSFVEETEDESFDESGLELGGEDDDDGQDSAEEILGRYKETLKLYENYEGVSEDKEMAKDIFRLQIIGLDGYFDVLGFSSFGDTDPQSTADPHDKTVYEGMKGVPKKYSWRRDDYDDVWATGTMKPHKMETGQSIWALANIWDMLNEIKILSSASKLHPSLPQDLKEYHAGEFWTTRNLLSNYFSEHGEAREKIRRRVLAWMSENEGNVVWLYKQYLILRKKVSPGRK